MKAISRGLASIRRNVCSALIRGTALALGLCWAFPIHAEGEVTDCTEAAFRAALAGGGLVTFADNCTITLSNVITITRDTTIDAQGFDVIIQGRTNSTPRLFRVQGNSSNPPVSLELIGLTLRNGRSSQGGALHINSNAVAELIECTIEENIAVGGAGANGDHASSDGGNGQSGAPGGAGAGGAIYNLGDLTLTLCHFELNDAIGGDGGNGGNGGDAESGSINRGGDGGSGAAGGSARGGAIYNEGVLSVTDCTFTDNSAAAGHGGAGGEAGGGFTPGNAGSGAAGGSALGAAIYSTTPVSIFSSTFSDNFTQGGDSADGGTLSTGHGADGPRGGEGSGAGLYTLEGGMVVNCTFFQNEAAGGAGGNGGPAVRSLGTGGDGGNGGPASGGGLFSIGDIEVLNCTLARCSAIGGTNGVGGAGDFEGGNGNRGQQRGGNLASGGGGDFLLKNSIVSSNLAGGNGFGPITDDGHNLSSDSSISFGATSKKNINPGIDGALGDNGGPTLTLALLEDSPALDAADDAAAPDTDQRGFPRPNGPRSDIGSVEEALSPTLTVRVVEGTNNLAGVTIEIGDELVLTTGADGRIQTEVPDGTYTVTPSKTGYVFTPESIEVSLPPGASITFTGMSSFTISGRVFDGAVGLSNVTVSIDSQHSAVTDPSGAYTISNLSGGTYFVFASRPGYTFGAAREVSGPPAVTGIDFYVSNRTFTVSGVVLQGTNGLGGVTFQEFPSLTTDSNGVFRLSGLTPDTYTFTPRVTTNSTIAFTPRTHTVVITNQDVTNLVFQAGTVLTGFGILPNGDVRFSVTGPIKTNWIEASTNLRDWESIYTNTTVPFQFRDTNAQNFPTRYYRVRPR